MLKKVSHIILSILLVVSTTGLTYTKHYCSAQTFQAKHNYKKEHTQKAHAHDFMEKKHDIIHVHSQNHEHTNKNYLDSHSQNDLCTTQECTSDAPCCDSETCNDDNCCKNETITVKLSLDYIIIDSKEIFKAFEHELFNATLITSYNNLFKETNTKFNRFLITDSPHKIKNTPSILQNFRC
ncbi:MAG: hypothetical protein L3J74_18620 [Bacteroidales bacterium]|nr:hypothetical protein [Bacteroidales bacterium]